jgi:hypothetical protein
MAGPARFLLPFLPCRQKSVPKRIEPAPFGNGLYSEDVLSSPPRATSVFKIDATDPERREYPVLKPPNQCPSTDDCEKILRTLMLADCRVLRNRAAVQPVEIADDDLPDGLTARQRDEALKRFQPVVLPRATSTAKAKRYG